MPRQTSRKYFESRGLLTRWWSTNATTFGLVSQIDQRYLHDYFLPSVSMSDEDLLRYRKKVSAGQPSLPQCAGRALKKLQAAIEAGQTASGLNVRAVARPSVDADAMGRVLAKLAHDLDDKDAA